MGRLAQKGLEYFSIDTSWETAVKLVKAKYGALEGVGFLMELWASIYRENYYREWNDETELLFSDEIKKPVEWVHEVIEYCFEKKILDKDIFNAKGVLTSHGIQKRYFKVARDSLGRNYIDYIEGITYPEFMPKNNLPENSDKVPPYTDKVPEKADKVQLYADAYKGIQGNLKGGGEERASARDRPFENPKPEEKPDAMIFRILGSITSRYPLVISSTLATKLHAYFDDVGEATFWSTFNTYLSEKNNRQLKYFETDFIERLEEVKTKQPPTGKGPEEVMDSDYLAIKNGEREEKLPPELEQQVRAMTGKPAVNTS